MFAWLLLLLFSASIALIGVLSFKYLSNQNRLSQARNQCIARLLEILLFGDSIRGLIRSFYKLLIGLMHYLATTIKPLVVALLPISGLLFCSQALLEHTPPNISQPFLIEATHHADTPPSISLSSHIIQTAPALYISEENRSIWRLQRTSAETSMLQIAGHQFTFAQPETISWIPPFQNSFLTIDYPKRVWMLGTFSFDWLPGVLLFSIFFAFIFAKITATTL